MGFWDATERERAEGTLRESWELFEAAFEESAIGIAIVDLEGRIRESNPTLQRMLECSGEELRGTLLTERNYPDNPRKDVGLYDDLVAGQRDQYQIEKRYVRKDGYSLWWRLTVSLVRGNEGEPQFAVCMVEDVTDRERIEELRRSESRLYLAQRIAQVGNWEYLIEEDEIHWSDEMYRIFGLAPCEFVPTYKRFLRFVHSDDRVLIRKAVREVLRTGKNPGFDYRVVRPNGEVRSVHTQYEVLCDEAEKPMGLVGTVHDITERKALEERLEQQAFRDPLTGLPNRALFIDRLQRALARKERREETVAMLFLDLDDFKSVNDGFGHEAGDRLLVEVGTRLSSCLRPEDTVARLGGDEFTVLLEDIASPSYAARVAERIEEALRAPFVLGGQEWSISASIGVALVATSQERPEDLIQNADLALYKAKSKGKSRYEVFDPRTMARRSGKSPDLKRELEQALERDEFTVFYQPKISLRTGKIVGTEALVRWEHPERGLLIPPEFVPLAEETGLIVPIGYKVLEQACRQVQIWRNGYPGISLTMCINLSAVQFNEPRVVEVITKVSREIGVEPDDLSLEIPEDVLMKHPESALSKLRLLREFGVRVSVDDFGTSDSSLSSLVRFPLNFLNLDRSLIFRLGEESEDTPLLSTTIAFAHAMGWEVTAEGVETADQLTQLRALDCDIAQGYYLWEPLSSAELSNLLERI